MEDLVNTLKLSYNDSPNSTSQASWGVVFIHGFPFDQTMWAAQVSALKGRCRTIAYDQRGHGKTPATGPYLFESLVDDLIGLLDHLKLQQAVLCGLSMGGYVALRAAERNPERVKGLVLCDTKSESDPDAARLNRAKDLAAIRKDGLNAFASAFARRTLTAATVQNNPQILAGVEKMIASNPVQGVEAALVALATRTDTTESLAKIKAPTLILVGEQDPITPPAASQKMHERIVGSTLVQLPNASHLSNLENTEAFNAALLSFLQTIAAR